MQDLTPFRGRIGYVLPRFPKVSETFILFEIVELERLGLDVDLYALVRERPAVMHPEAARLVERAHFPAAARRAVLAAQLHWLRRRPRRYLRAWWRALRGNARSPKFLSRALVAVPVGAWFAREIERSDAHRVHAHYATHSALAAWVVSTLTDVPYSFTAHAHDLYVETPMLSEKVAAAESVVAISRFNRELIGRLCGPEAE